jgi:hypothetical protein
MSASFFTASLKSPSLSPGLQPGLPAPGFPSSPSLTGAVGRWRADTGVTTSGGHVTTWVDSVGSVSLAPYAGNSIPFNATSVNSQPGVTFDQTTGLFTTSNGVRLGNVPIYIVVVCKTATVSGTECPLACGGGPWFIPIVGQPSGDVYSDAGSRTQACAFTPSISTAYELEWGWDGNTSHLTTFSHNGTNESVSQTAGTGTVGGQGTTFTIGNVTNVTAGLGIGFIGDILEVIVYSAVQSGGSLSQTRQYIKGRYGIG